MTDGGLQPGAAPAPHDAAALEAALNRAIAERDAWAQELFESNRFAAQLVRERQRLADDLANVTEREAARANEAALPHLEAAWRERDLLRSERDEAQRELARALEREAAAEAALRRVTSSTSWRLTAPLRGLLLVLRGRPV